MEANTPALVLKRALTSAADLDFFKPAESSFNPRPYTPSANPLSGTHSKNRYNHLSRHTTRPEVHVIPPASMDPSPTDPNAVFIHPPFNNFPNVQDFPEGLTYKVMADNPEWFLDAADFIRVEENSSETSPSTDPQRPSFLGSSSPRLDVLNDGTHPSNLFVVLGPRLRPSPSPRFVRSSSFDTP
ncbi:hypothetical protein C8R42DRAFT_725669 [Lentinula raphanica]|nr:hypothetical protein C8R42DRAFT_725669 [Lentinula raphanica]